MIFYSKTNKHGLLSRKIRKLEKLLLVFGSIIFLHVLFPFSMHAQSITQSPPAPAKQDYFRGKVIEIIKEEEKEIAGYKNFSQKARVQLTSGSEKGKKVVVEQGGIVKITPQQKLAVGEKVIVLKTSVAKSKDVYSVMDKYRLQNVLFVLFGFFLLVIAIAGKKGLGSIAGLCISFLVIIKFIVPQILNGHDPLLISILGSLIILVTTIYLAHGFSKKISVAVLSTFLSLVITGIFSYLFVFVGKLSGLGNENTFLLQFGPHNINLQGILLGGMIIGALGVLDDITTTQSATVFELAETDKKLSFSNLFAKGFSVGKEHITSLVNTLVLAYAGVSLGLFLLFEINPANQPYWVILNSEVIIEEVMRTLAGSIGLILAVPITTLLAAFAATRKQ